MYGTKEENESREEATMGMAGFDGIGAMETAELHHAPTGLIVSTDEDYPPVRTYEDVKYVCLVESTKLWGIAGPIAFNILCNYGMNSFTSIFVGHIGDLELSAIAISLNVIANFSFGFLVSNSFFFSQFCKLHPQFLLAQSRVGILAWIGFGALIFHVGLLLLFIKVFDWGTAGAAAAYDVSAWGISMAQVVYIVGWCTECWKGLSWLAFKDLWDFVKLSIASAIMLCLEIWYFMTIIVLTGHLDDPIIAVGSLSICMNLNGWEGMLFIGINAAISVRVSNELGSGHPRAAKYSVIVTIIESLCIGLLFAALILATKDYFAVIFTESKEMQEAVSRLAFLLGITMVLNSVQPVISGVAVGGGWQALVAYINLFCYYVVGLPFGFLLGYKTSLGVEGIWIGMICGTFLQTMILLFIVYKTNWNKEVEQTSERMKRWMGKDSMSPDPT
ncbi:unnamed protein product [Citrullus colocynthis]|uniref:Protein DETOXIFICATION n=1 Tax=Citrullus colocynthis TaxID=252529 RepID=A0ABP0Z7R9_9ROSI